MNQDTTPEQLIQDARDRGKVLRCVPNGGDTQRMDFVRINGEALNDKYAGWATDEPNAHVWDPEDVLNHVRDTLKDGGEVLKVSQESTRWGEFDYGRE